MTTRLKVITGVALILGAAALTGCHSPTSPQGVRADLSPGMYSQARTAEQHRNMEARTIDMGFRQLADEGARLLLLDRPSRSTPAVTPW